jgi:asparagine synthase (glutamine-hydrolysing)
VSIQFGRWEFDGQATDPAFIRQAAALAAKYATGHGRAQTSGAVTFFFDPFSTTNESDGDTQPLLDSSGIMLNWDGRLDNREELTRRLQLPKTTVLTDAEMVMEAYKQWGNRSFAALLGDWALVLWNPRKQALLLAKDFIGTRHLFYRIEASRITWSTVLDPLVLLAGGPFAISEEFVSGYLSSCPATHLTPYVGINAVPACTFLQVEHGRATTNHYWEFNPSFRVRYRQDCQYKQHFRQIFTEAVRRRLRSTAPVLAELSGGMDSTSIVCVADSLFTAGQTPCPRLDTISYYDDEEPNWDERPFFSLVEKRRGCEGHHIYVGGTEGAFLPPDSEIYFPLPGTDRFSLERAREFGGAVRQSQSRVLLSGIGGDEFLGGVPTPIPELQDLLVRGRVLGFARQLFEFGLRQRRPWIHLCFDAAEEFLPQFLRRLYTHPPIVPWLTSTLVRRNIPVFWANKQRTKFFGPRPSFQAGISTVNHMRRQLNCSHLTAASKHRVTYPFLDRELLAFLLAIPREQLVRPGERRSLMRRALAGLVPAEIFSRRRKAYLTRQPLASIDSALRTMGPFLESPLLARLGWIEKQPLMQALLSAKRGEVEYMVPLLGTLKVELWLRSLDERRLLDFSQCPHS